MDPTMQRLVRPIQRSVMTRPGATVADAAAYARVERVTAFQRLVAMFVPASPDARTASA